MSPSHAVYAVQDFHGNINSERTSLRTAAVILKAPETAEICDIFRGKCRAWFPDCNCRRSTQSRSLAVNFMLF